MSYKISYDPHFLEEQNIIQSDFSWTVSVHIKETFITSYGMKRFYHIWNLLNKLSL